MLTTGALYDDPGPDWYTRHDPERAKRRAISQLRDLGYDVSVPSYFDGSRHAECGWAAFLHAFVRAITMPVISDGRQHVEYTPTQVLTEYLRWIPMTVIDGLALPSAQSPTGTRTYVLFFNGEDCVDADEYTAAQAAPRHGFLDVDLVGEPPSFELSRGDIQVWKVQRNSAGTPCDDV